MLLNLNNKEFDKIVTLIGNPVDYFDFPSSLLAFAYSLKGSSLFVHGPGLFRRKNRNLTLISYFCAGKEIDKILSDLSKTYKIKALNWANKDFTELKVKFYAWDFFVERGYCAERLLISKTGRSRNRLRAKLNKAEAAYETADCLLLDLPQIMSVFDGWVENAKTRHFMVIKGHYLSYIQRHFEKHENTYFIGFKNVKTDELFGFAGYEVFKSKAQITLMKHLVNDYNFPVFFWLKTIEKIFADRQVEKIFCGMTADKLKRSLMMESKKSFKIDTSCY